MRSAPILAAYGVAGNPLHWVVPCRFCGGLHVHGAEEGHRAPHCPDGRGPSSGYILRYAGMAPIAMQRRYRQRSNAWNAMIMAFMRDWRNSR